MEFIVFLIITVINFILGVTIILKGIKNKVNISFFFVILSIIFWAISNYLGDYFAESVKNEFFSTLFTRLAYTAATLIAVLFLYFVLIFPREKIKTSKIKYFLQKKSPTFSQVVINKRVKKNKESIILQNAMNLTYDIIGV